MQNATDLLFGCTLQLMKWVNAIGLIFQFISFWLAAPELLGEATLQRFEKGLHRFLSALPLVIILIVVFGYGLTFSISGLVLGLSASEEEITINQLIAYYVVLFVCTLFYFIFIFRFKKIRNYLERQFAIPLTNKLINNNRTRKNALVIGAILFTVGFLLQLMVIILS